MLHRQSTARTRQHAKLIYYPTGQRHPVTSCTGSSGMLATTTWTVLLISPSVIKIVVPVNLAMLQLLEIFLVKLNPLPCVSRIPAKEEGRVRNMMEHFRATARKASLGQGANTILAKLISASPASLGIHYSVY